MFGHFFTVYVILAVFLDVWYNPDQIILNKTTRKWKQPWIKILIGSFFRIKNLITELDRKNILKCDFDVKLFYINWIFTTKLNFTIKDNDDLSSNVDNVNKQTF